VLLTISEIGKGRQNYSIKDEDQIINFVSGDAWIRNKYVNAVGALNYFTVKMREDTLLDSKISRVTLTWFDGDDMKMVEHVKNIMKKKVEEAQ